MIPIKAYVPHGYAFCGMCVKFIYYERMLQMIYLETDRLILRNYQLKDINDFYELMSQEFVARHQNFVAPLSLERCKQSVTKRLDNDSYLVCELKENGKVIGT